jgi:hypothetical protein
MKSRQTRMQGARKVSHLVAASFALAGLTACGSPEPAAPPAATAEAPPTIDPAAYRTVPVEELGIASAADAGAAAAAVEQFASGGETPSEGRYVRSVSQGTSSDGQWLTVTVTESGLLDDSIGGRETVVIFERASDGFAPRSAGQRQQCSRAPDPSAWTIAACP